MKFWQADRLVRLMLRRMQYTVLSRSLIASVAANLVDVGFNEVTLLHLMHLGGIVIIDSSQREEAK